MTKKDIYANYGIEYANGKINTPIGWMVEPLKVGNSKTGRAVRTWSMNQTTCPCHCRGCYADSGCYQFANVKRALADNTTLAKEHLDFLESALMGQCATFKDGTEVRIHAVGDFFSIDYLSMWHRIAESYPRLIFWTYTKVVAFETAFDDLSNANIVRSVIPKYGFNFGHCDHIITTYKALIEKGEEVHICRCGIDDNHHCHNCHKCSEYNFVLFIEHSTNYDAKSDPLYNEIVTLVDSQKY